MRFSMSSYGLNLFEGRMKLYHNSGFHHLGRRLQLHQSIGGGCTFASIREQCTSASINGGSMIPNNQRSCHVEWGSTNPGSVACTNYIKKPEIFEIWHFAIVRDSRVWWNARVAMGGTRVRYPPRARQIQLMCYHRLGFVSMMSRHRAGYISPLKCNPSTSFLRGWMWLPAINYCLWFSIGRALDVKGLKCNLPFSTSYRIYNWLDSVRSLWSWGTMWRKLFPQRGKATTGPLWKATSACSGHETPLPYIYWKVWNYRQVFNTRSGLNILHDILPGMFFTLIATNPLLSVVGTSTTT